MASDFKLLYIYIFIFETIGILWLWCSLLHYMSVMASQITGSSIVYFSKACSKKTPKLRFTGLFWEESADGRWIPLTTGSVMQKAFLCEDVIMWVQYGPVRIACSMFTCFFTTLTHYWIDDSFADNQASNHYKFWWRPTPLYIARLNTQNCNYVFGECLYTILTAAFEYN